MTFLEVRWLCLCVFDLSFPDERFYVSSAGVGGFTLGFHMLCVACECSAGRLLIHGWAFRFTPGRCAAFSTGLQAETQLKVLGTLSSTLEHLGLLLDACVLSVIPLQCAGSVLALTGFFFDACAWFSFSGN